MPTFAKSKYTSESYYDLIEDYDLIEASFAQQYSIRLRLEDEMLWDEFCNLLSGLNGDTPLGYVVRIRSEKDHKRINKYSKEERKIYDDWRKRKSRKAKVTRSFADTDDALKRLAEMFK